MHSVSVDPLPGFPESHPSLAAFYAADRRRWPSRERDAEVIDAGHLAVAPGRAIMVADTPGRVATARAGGFAAVIAVAPNGGRAALLSAGADIVVRDLGELVP